VRFPTASDGAFAGCHTAGESLAAQRFALLAGGRAWTMLGSRRNSKPEKCLNMVTNPTCPVHAVLARQDDLPMLDIMLHHHFDQVLDGTPLIPRIQHLNIPSFGWHCLHEQLELVA